MLLDLTGPLEAFSLARAQAPGCYRLRVVSLEGGDIESSAGLAVTTQKAKRGTFDTFVVVGDFGLAESDVSPETVAFIRAASAKARRTASVCMGAFLLAASGILDGRRATTHWRYAARMQARYPSVSVDGDRIYINDGRVWTSAGMTSGIDMALALITEDLGKEVARSVARMMVVYYQRPGGQYQHSSLLELDTDSDRLRDVLTYAREHLTEPLSVEQLAEVAHLSVRQFSRRFSAKFAMTPAKAVERLRVEVARPLVEDGFETLDIIASRVGFEDPERMRAGFVRILGQTPRALRRIARAGHAHSTDVQDAIAEEVDEFG